MRTQFLHKVSIVAVVVAVGNFSAVDIFVHI